MKKIALLFALAIAGMAACKKDAEKEDNQIICIMPPDNCTCSPEVREYVFRGDTLYVQVYRSPICDYVPQYAKKPGYTPYTLPEGVTHDVFLQEAKLVKTVWSCPDSATAK